MPIVDLRAHPAWRARQLRGAVDGVLQTIAAAADLARQGVTIGHRADLATIASAVGLAILASTIDRSEKESLLLRLEPGLRQLAAAEGAPAAMAGVHQLLSFIDLFVRTRPGAEAAADLSRRLRDLADALHLNAPDEDW